MAVEQDGALSQPFSSLRDADGDSEAIALVNLPIQSVIPRTIWVHLGVAALLFALAFGGRIAMETLPQYYGVDTSLLRGIVAKTEPLFAGLCLFATTQLCVVIRQVRGRSRTDFDGRYRVWNWIVAAAGLFTASLFLNLHAEAGPIVAATLDRPNLANSPLVWQVPVVVFGGLLLLALRREMRDSRLTCALLHVTCLCYLVPLAGSLELLAAWPGLSIPPLLGLPGTSIALKLGHILLFTTMSLHARYVVHFNPEPPTSIVRQFRVKLPRVRGLRFPLPRIWFPRLTVPRVRLPKLSWKLRMPKLRLPAVQLPKLKINLPKRKPRPVAKNPPDVKPVAPVAKQAADTSRRTRVEPAHAAPPAPAPVIVDAAEETAPAPSKKNRQQQSQRASKRPIEDQIDDVTPEELKGLSKKQKRQLRKQRREAQRAAR